jgi:hypothetical protein
VTEHDPLEILREIARKQREQFTGAPDAEFVLQRVRAVLTDTPPTIRKKRWGRGIIAGIVVAVLGAGGGIAWAVLHHERASNPTLITCHQTANLDSSQIVINDDGTDPIQLCAHAWTLDFPEWGTPPPMVGCVLASGEAAVFPGDSQTCEQLGLTSLDTTLTNQDQSLIAFQDALTQDALSKGCIPPEQLKTIVDTHLASSKLVGWRVQIDGSFTTAMPCGSLSIDVETKSITIRPLPDIFTTNPGG